MASCLAAIKTGGSKPSHITGGGFPDSIPRALPPQLGVRLDLTRVPILPVFRWLAVAGGISETEMLRTFNCGIGMVVIVASAQADAVAATLTQAGESVVRLGEVVAAREDARVIYDGHLDLA